MGRLIVLIIAAAFIFAIVFWFSQGPGESATIGESAGAERSGFMGEPEQAAVAAAAPVETSPPVTQAPSRSSPPAEAESFPIDVSPGFEYLDRPASEMSDADGMSPAVRRHRQLESEPRDEAWAPRMEATLRGGILDSLTARGLDAQRIELPVVECRTTGCEIQAVGHLEEDPERYVDLPSILSALIDGSLESEFDRAGYGLMMSPREDQRMTYLAHLRRKMP